MQTVRARARGFLVVAGSRLRPSSASREIMGFLPRRSADETGLPGPMMTVRGGWIGILAQPKWPKRRAVTGFSRVSVTLIGH
jgi:hypothetical protein